MIFFPRTIAAFASLTAFALVRVFLQIVWNLLHCGIYFAVVRIFIHKAGNRCLDLFCVTVYALLLCNRPLGYDAVLCIFQCFYRRIGIQTEVRRNLFDGFLYFGIICFPNLQSCQCIFNCCCPAVYFCLIQNGFSAFYAVDRCLKRLNAFFRINTQIIRNFGKSRVYGAVVRRFQGQSVKSCFQVFCKLIDFLLSAVIQIPYNGFFCRIQCFYTLFGING